MKKILLILTLMCALLTVNISAFAYNARITTYAYTKDGVITSIRANITTYINDSEEITLDTQPQDQSPDDALYGLCDNYDYLLTYDFKTTDGDNLYPSIEKMEVNIFSPSFSGGRNPSLGKNYRLYYVDNDIIEEIPYENIIDGISFTTNKLGRYVLYFEEATYDVEFYSDEPTYDDDGNVIAQEPFCTLTDLKASDIIEFPEVPKRDGYVFTGWKAWSGSGIYFISPQPHTAINPAVYYASWCPEDEYEPINITLTSDDTITKGKEDGSKITLQTNYGIFVEGDDFPSEWRAEYDAETDEQLKEDILSYWKSKWNVVGSDDIMIESAQRIDDKTVDLVLSGNSNDIYSNSEIFIEFDSSLLMPEPYEENDEIITWDDTKIKMDSDGVRAKMYQSDNAVSLVKQNRPSSNGGSSEGIIRYTVTFEANNGDKTTKQTVNKNTMLTKPTDPIREGYTFVGWFTDKELTKEYDFNDNVTRNITLYAKWEPVEAPEPTEEPVTTDNRIILTVGEKEASVFGEVKLNDVAPVVKNDRTMLPARFIAESLGADVMWDQADQQVTITKGDTVIVITIGSDTAYINEMPYTLDSPAFVENDRTYTPLRFISEQLGASVDWNEETQEVIITQ